MISRFLTLLEEEIKSEILLNQVQNNWKNWNSDVFSLPYIKYLYIYKFKISVESKSRQLSQQRFNLICNGPLWTPYWPPPIWANFNSYGLKLASYSPYCQVWVYYGPYSHHMDPLKPHVPPFVPVVPYGLCGCLCLRTPCLLPIATDGWFASF